MDLILTLLTILFVTGGGGSVIVLEVAVRRVNFAKRAAVEFNITGAIQDHKIHKLRDYHREGLLPEDVEFLRTNGWEPEIPKHRALAAGVAPAPGLGMRAIPAPPKPRPKPKPQPDPLAGRWMTEAEFRRYAKNPSTYTNSRKIVNLDGQTVYTLEEDM